MDHVCITGIGGYLGSHIARRLLARGFEVVGLNPVGHCVDRLADIRTSVRLYDCDAVGIETCFSENAIQVVVHCATNYGRDVSRLSDLVAANVLFPLRVMESAISHRALAFINTHTTLPAKVSDYAFSKHQFHALAQRVCTQIPLITLHLEHFYGPGEQSHVFINRMIHKLLDHEDIPLTSGAQRRDFIHIHDVVNAYERVTLDIVKKGVARRDLYTRRDLYIGTGDPWPVEAVLRKLKALTESKSRLGFGEVSYRAGESMLSTADLAANGDFCWRPEIDLQKGLDMVVAYEKEHHR